MSFIIQRVETGALFWCPPATDAKTLEEHLARWFHDRQELLSEYRIRRTDLRVKLLDPSLTDQISGLLAPGSISRHTFDLFERREFERAQTYLAAVEAAYSVALARKPHDFLAMILADISSRAAFFAGACGDAGLGRANALRALDLSNDDAWLKHYNLAYMRALDGEYAAAADALVRSEELIGSDSAALLLLFLPKIPGWRKRAGRPECDTAPASADALAVVRAQRHVYEALSGRYSRDEFLAVVSTRKPGIAATERLVGWALLARFNDVETASECFARASMLADNDERKAAEREKRFSMRLAEGREATNPQTAQNIEPD
jgi:hypothetical protein